MNRPRPALRARLTPTLRRLALAVACCGAGLASAQSSAPAAITLYGLADAGLTRVSGLKAGTLTELASGIMEGSRWGLKGSEDLGGGYRSVFTLESRVYLDSGATGSRPITGAQLSDRYSQAALLGLPGALQPAVDAVDAALATEFGVNVGASGNRLFDRQAFVGLVTPVGAVLAGRQYTPVYESFSLYDIMATQSALSAAQIVAFPAVIEVRSSNSLMYRVQQGGLSGALMWAAGELAGGSDKGRMLGFNLNYKRNGFALGGGYNTRNNELGQQSLRTALLGASLNWGGHTLNSHVARIRDDHPGGLSAITPLLTSAIGASNAALVESKFIDAFKQDGTLFQLGYRHVRGPHSVTLAYNHYNDRRPNNADVASWGTAYSYALSKRTDLNAVLVRINNQNLAQAAPGGNAYIGGVTATAGTDSTSLALGIRHRF